MATEHTPRTAVVTGAGSRRGIGRATAHALAAAGYHIAVLDLDKAAAEDTAREVAARHGVEALGALGGIGVGLTGPIGPPGEALPGAAHRDTVSALVSERFGMPVCLDSDTRLATLAERTWGAAVDEQDVLYLCLSHSVGGGLVVGGRLHRGAHGVSGQFGHIAVDPEGESCPCGRVGCLETVASIGAVLDAHGSATDVPQLVAALDAGDEAAYAALARAGTLTGKVLADLCNAFGPGVIVLGGELTGTGPALMEPLRRELDANATCRGSRTPLRVRPAELGDAGAALGALALLLHRS